MIREIASNLLRLAFLTALQVLVLNHIQIGAYIVPYVYIWGVMRLPLKTPPALLLILSFGIGLVMDVFCYSLGFHAFACLLAAMSRHLFVKATIPHELVHANISLSIAGAGFGWFLRYAILLVLVHHFALFYMEIFQWNGLWDALLRTLLSGALSLLLIVLCEFFTRRKR